MTLKWAKERYVDGIERKKYWNDLARCFIRIQTVSVDVVWTVRRGAEGSMFKSQLWHRMFSQNMISIKYCRIKKIEELINVYEISGMFR